MLARLRSADIDRLRGVVPGYPHASLLSAMEISVDDLLEPSLRTRYLDLAVFPGRGHPRSRPRGPEPNRGTLSQARKIRTKRNHGLRFESAR